jgi:hypothetical protein
MRSNSNTARISLQYSATEFVFDLCGVKLYQFHKTDA